MKSGDMIVSVESERSMSRWSREKDAVNGLEEALQWPRPLTISFQTGAMGAAERLQKKKALEELLTLRAIKQDSQCCPKCRVRIMRSQGCNHMKCTNCETHFCYRCGTTLDPKDPYKHFKAEGCPTFDAEEVRRMVVEQRHENVDHDLEEL